LERKFSCKIVIYTRVMRFLVYRVIGGGWGKINAISIDQFMDVDIMNLSRNNNASCIYLTQVNFTHDKQ